ncbi:hypothetical protein [Nitrincola alkalilacustris]|uniref:hypothetical protein n=1 Tax=Nitrincola alkalilacustris TaxID=1571224 RepID=UPI00124C57B6|nr:hypothetical protein [Nitrincola alkalilacustris]
MKSLITGCLLLCLSALAVADQSPRIGSGVPVLNSMLLSLLQDTDIEVVYVVPERLPINRIPAWLNRAESGEVEALDALLTIESVWPQLKLYPLLRQASIRVVPIDVAHELAPGGSRVILMQGREDSDLFWMDLNNLSQMVNVGARDIIRLWPDQATRIERNRLALQRSVQQSQVALDELLMRHDISSVGVSDERLYPLAHALGLPLMQAEDADLLLSLSDVSGPIVSGLIASEQVQSQWVINAMIQFQSVTLEKWLAEQLIALENSLTGNERS